MACPIAQQGTGVIESVTCIGERFAEGVADIASVQPLAQRDDVHLPARAGDSLPGLLIAGRKFGQYAC